MRSLIAFPFLLIIFDNTGSLLCNSMAAEEAVVGHGHDVAGVTAPAAADLSQLDAGALFVLKSKGSWMHCGYHLTTSIVAPALLSLPFALASLGWAPGIACLVVGAVVTFYSYNLLSLVLDHYAQLGRRQLRFRDMAHDILGPGWGRFYVGPIQFLVCFGAVVGQVLLGGQSMKTIYLIARPGGTMRLHEFVIVFGAFMLVLAQIPSFHSLRHINLVSLLLCLSYSACAAAGSIHAGTNAPQRDYSLPGNGQDRLFGALNAIAIVATTYGNGIIPEIQATAAPPVTGKMFKGLCLCYAVVVATFFSVAISGYWAFGNRAQGYVLANFDLEDGTTLVPKWFLAMTTVLTLLQLAAVGVRSERFGKRLLLLARSLRLTRGVKVVYLQPTNEALEGLFADPRKDQYSARNVTPRLVFRSLSIVVATLLAAMLPFFGDINAVIGAFGFLPLDFVVPSVFYNLTFKPSKRGVVFWLNTAIAVISSMLALLGSISAVRQVVLDAKTFKLFANV
ncbi:Histone deacetylase [Musa troglodytarum]|uniref:Histone deacetylase n=1 Tax=Musa troglodytarum TaxID=320322 RepID=A0A9E7HAI6_9LILI|nr:Histone deacetylase [Musa troglodytarum]